MQSIGCTIPKRTPRLVALAMLAVVFGTVAAQPPEDPAPASPHRGVLIEIPAELDEEASLSIRQRLRSLIQPSVESTGARTVVVLRFGAADQEGVEASFEAALGLARFLTSADAAKIRSVAWLSGRIDGHQVLPLLACEQILVSPEARLGPVTAAEDVHDSLTQLTYSDIAQRRATVPAEVVSVLLDDSRELVSVTDLDGRQMLLSGDALAEYRASGKGWQERTLVEAGVPASFDGPQLREMRWATHLVDDAQSAADAVGVSTLTTSTTLEGDRRGIRVNLLGPIRPATANRTTAIIADAVSDGADVVVIVIDSPGGELLAAGDLARYVKSLPEDGVSTVAWVQPQALGSAALVVAACQTVLMSPDARLGGPGDQNVQPEDLNELSSSLGDYVRHPVGLVAGLLGSESPVHQYQQRRTGRVAYFTLAQFKDRDDQQQWVRGERVNVGEGLKSDRALQLGLASAVVESVEDVQEHLGLQTPLELREERPLVQWVQRFGNTPGLPFLLIFIGFMALSMEMGAPGIGIPGFVSLVCFVLFFWIRYLSGTVEWLELSLFVVGVGCVLAEVFLLPGFGVFGFGGLGLIIVSLVLTSQTFIIPQNSYQYGQTAKALFTVIAAAGGVIGGIVGLRFFLPHAPGLKHLVLEPLDYAEIDQREQLSLFDDLVGRTGTAVTPLLPSGKVRIDDRVVQVVSDGTTIDVGKEVRVVEVHGNRVRVESV